jgi:hypothetical protein
VVGSCFLASSNVAVFAPGGAARQAVRRKEASYCDILRLPPPSVAYLSFAFETLGGFHGDGIAVLARLQGVVNLAGSAHDNNVWFSVVRQVSIAKDVGRQLADSAVYVVAVVGESFPLAWVGSAVGKSRVVVVTRTDVKRKYIHFIEGVPPVVARFRVLQGSVIGFHEGI